MGQVETQFIKDYEAKKESIELIILKLWKKFDRKFSGILIKIEAKKVPNLSINCVRQLFEI